MGDLMAGDARYHEDHGAADPAVAAALAAFAEGRGGERAVLTALAGSRLLVPVVAVLADGAGTAADAASTAGPRPGVLPGGEKASEMAMPEIVGRDGRRAIPAFTCADSLQRWRAGARPVPVPAAGVWQAAVQESRAVVIDIAGPVPIAVEGSRLAALAAGEDVPGLDEDPDVWQQVAAAAAEVAPGIRVRLSPPKGDLDFTLELAPPAGSAGLVPEEVASRIADVIRDRLPFRIRAGIAVIRRPG
ncbi:MAG TPA: SseB family protein [Streptosporangiaceae bacterium]|nr:SseB family protein [Streptosporangiaceae bacterium]